MSFTFSIIDNFISDSDADNLLDYYRQKLSKSKTLNDNITSEYSKLRTSQDYYISESLVESEEIKKIISYLKTKISEDSNIPIENQELLNIIRYLPGEQFQNHYDGFHKNSSYYANEMKLGGQRLKTYIICLQKATLGGYTGFPKINQNILLERGQCISWDNVDNNGDILEDSMHCGRCPIEGEKWIITCWIRENKYVEINRNNI